MIDLTEEPKLSDVLDFGQADDDRVNEIVQAFFMIYNGYYRLTLINEEWWKGMNQDVFFVSQIKEQWERVNQAVFEDVLNKIANALVGGYVKKERFVEALQKLSDMSIGYRPGRNVDND